MDYFDPDDDAGVDSFRKVFFGKIHKRLIQEQNLEEVISKLLEKKNLSPDFNIHFKIRELNFFKYPDSLDVYEEKADLNWNYADTLAIPEEALLVGTNNHEGTFFRIKFDSYVDFVDKKRIVIGQMVGILVIMALALMIVAAVFTITLRNMLEERRLSQLKTDFINNMTHELKTPLSTIAIATKTLANPKMIDEKEKVLSMAQMIGRQI